MNASLVNDERFMRNALKNAKKSFEIGEVPIGAILVKSSKIVSMGYNMKEKEKSPFKHAEFICISKYVKKYNTWRLNNLTIYVTMEPCLMCYGLILETRIKRLVFGVKNSQNTSLDLINKAKYNHHLDIKQGILKNECKKILDDFFYKIRRDK